MPKQREGLRSRDDHSQVNYVVPNALRERVEEYHHKNHRRFPTISEAAAHLLESGLRAEDA